MDSYRGFICEDYVSSSESDGDELMQSSTSNAYSQKHLFSSSKTGRTKKEKCLSRNAVMARENRKRKKLYMETIESEVKFLREANHRLEHENKKNKKEINSLKKEVTYLRNVLSNSSSIEKLLKGINKGLNPNVIVKAEPRVGQINRTVDEPLLGDPLLSSAPGIYNSFLSRQDNSDVQNQEGTQDFEDEFPQVGICLHVNNGHLSLGLCPLCNSSSMDSGLLM